MARDGREIFVTGHMEYSPDTLDTEYKRDMGKRDDVELPKNYYIDNDMEKGPLVTWRAHANLFYHNWINYYIYQRTPYDINKIKEKIESRYKKGRGFCIIVVAEGSVLELGKHTLEFIAAPNVHWPEVVFSYDKTSKILFSADGFGKFGTLDTKEDWLCEARRYYFNIVGKYGVQVQALLKKLSGYEINAIYPLHGPVLTENLGFYLDKYNTWSSYIPEDKGIFIAYASIHGNTAKTAGKLAEILASKTTDKITVADLSRSDMAECVEDAFRYDRMILASSTYDGGIFPCMENFLNHLKSKNYQCRTVGLIENGTWAPTAAKQMKAIVEGFKNIEMIEPVVTIKSTLNENSRAQMDELVQNLVK